MVKNKTTPPRFDRTPDPRCRLYQIQNGWPITSLEFRVDRMRFFGPTWLRDHVTDDVEISTNIPHAESMILTKNYFSETA